MTENKALAFFRRISFIVLVCALFLIGVALTIQYWAEPQKAQTVTSLLSFSATVILLAVTWLYVRTTKEQVSLLREQWEEGHKARLSFSHHVERNTFRDFEYSANRIVITSQVVYLEVWNLGQPTLIVHGVRFTQNLTGRTRAIEAHEIIRSRAVGKVDITEMLLKILSHSDDFIEIVNAPAVMRQMDVRLIYSFGAGNKISKAETFEFSPSLDNGQLTIVVVEPPIIVED
jgi:hypothetical protein